MEIASEDLPFGINASYWDRWIAVMEIASEDREWTKASAVNPFYFNLFQLVDNGLSAVLFLFSDYLRSFSQ